MICAGDLQEDPTSTVDFRPRHSSTRRRRVERYPKIVGHTPRVVAQEPSVAGKDDLGMSEPQVDVAQRREK